MELNLLAIVIPYYKLTFFEETLKSLGKQTDKRFKVYIGDDASPENSEILLEKYKGKFDFEYHRFAENLGGKSLTQQWERCIALAGNEEWLMILGDDDVLGDNVVEEFYENILEIEALKISVIRYATYKINEKGHSISELCEHPKIENAVDFLFRKTRSSLSEYIFKKEKVNEIGFKDLPLGWGSDKLGVFEFSGFRNIFTINDSSIYIRISNFSISGKKSNIVLKNTAVFYYHYYIADKYFNLFSNSQKKFFIEELKKSSLSANEIKIINKYLKINWMLKDLIDMQFRFYGAKLFNKKEINMRKIIYRLIHKLGFKIENKNREKNRKLKYLSQFNIDYNINILLRSYNYVFQLKQKFSELTIMNKGNGFEVSFFDLIFFIESEEEFFILNEIYVTTDYSFNFNKEVVIIDIGANIGLASLYFSKKTNVKGIYSFEPVKETYEHAKHNFNLNLIALNKIHIENIGLAGNTREDFFLFDSSKKGRSGVRGEESKIYKLDTEKKKVYLKEASFVMKEIISSNSEYSIVVKMDCEGAEYEIFDNINSSGVIKSVDVFMIEWHDKGYEPIEKILILNNFVVFNSYLGEKSGMIYAVNKK